MRNERGQFIKGHTPLVSGDKHWKWSGDDVSYSAVHKWVAKEYGKPSLCEHCGTTKANTYNWANVSGHYKRNIEDWVRLCRSCHVKFDSIAAKAWETRRINGTDKGYKIPRKTHCRQGHEYNEANTYYHKTSPHCRICRKIRETSYASH